MLLLAAAHLLAANTTLRAEIEFVGILATSHTTRFALADTTTGKKDWIEQGQMFAGYKLVAYAPKDETLLLRRDGDERRVRLKDDAKIKSSRLELTGTITFGATEKVEVERATLQFDEENVFPLKEGIVYRITPTRLANGNHRYTCSIERVLAANKTERISAPAITTLPGQPFSLQVGELGFSFMPR